MKLCTVQCTFCSAQFTLYTTQFTSYNAQFTIYSVHCTLYGAQYSLYTGCLSNQCIEAAPAGLGEIVKYLGSINLAPLHEYSLSLGPHNTLLKAGLVQSMFVETIKVQQPGVR